MVPGASLNPGGGPESRGRKAGARRGHRAMQGGVTRASQHPPPPAPRMGVPVSSAFVLDLKGPGTEASLFPLHGSLRTFRTGG